MGKVILICGKIGSGKTTYANKLAKELNAVVFGHDELMLGLFGTQMYRDDPETYLRHCRFVENYVKRKAGEAACAGAIAVCENGFWSKGERDELRRYYAEMGVACELHYMDTPEPQRLENINKRNRAVQQGEIGHIFLDDKDIHHYFETPCSDEMDICVKWEENK